MSIHRGREKVNSATKQVSSWIQNPATVPPINYSVFWSSVAHLTVTGSITPNAAGEYVADGDFGGFPSYRRTDSAYYIISQTGVYTIIASPKAPGAPLWSRPDNNYKGAYSPVMGTGTATVSGMEDNYINLGTTTNLSVNNLTTFSVAGWFNMPGWIQQPSKVYAVATSKDEAWKLWMNPTFSEVGFVIGNWTGGYLALFRSTLITPNVWTHIAIVYNGGTGRLDAYKNGVKQARGTGSFYESTTLPANMSDTNAMETRVGDNPSTDVNIMNPNNVDELTIWNRALSDGEVNTLYNSGTVLNGDISLAPWNSGLMGGWHFDEGTGTSASDFSGNGNTGTLIGSVGWQIY